MTLLKFDLIEMEFHHRELPLRVVPRVGEEHAAEVPKKRGDLAQSQLLVLELSDGIWSFPHDSCASRTSSPLAMQPERGIFPWLDQTLRILQSSIHCRKRNLQESNGSRQFSETVGSPTRLAG